MPIGVLVRKQHLGIKAQKRREARADCTPSILRAHLLNGPSEFCEALTAPEARREGRPHAVRRPDLGHEIWRALTRIMRHEGGHEGGRAVGMNRLVHCVSQLTG